MIKTDANKQSLKALREKEKAEKLDILKKACNDFANEKIGEEEMKKLSNANKGLWFLPLMKEDDDTAIECMAILKPIDRHILSFASTKLEDDGLYLFLEQCMRDCFVKGINPDGVVVENADESVIIIDDDFFLPAAMKFNKVIESRKAAFVKR